MNRVSFFRSLIVASFAFSGGCTMGDAKAPPLTGPSELSLAIALTATPDLIAANGASQSVIGIVARDAFGQARGNVQLRVDTIDENGLIIEQGTLSQRLVTTNSNGQASVTFTAPMETIPGVDVNGTVTVRVLPVSTDSGSNLGRIVRIRLVPPTIVIVPGAPVPSFTFTPTSPTVGATVVFNASASFDPDGTIVSYVWNWDDADGDTPPRTSPVEDHDFAAARTYYVKLTVTDNLGNKTSLTKAVTVQ
jgi:PKD domain-containing protein